MLLHGIFRPIVTEAFNPHLQPVIYKKLYSENVFSRRKLFSQY